MKKLIWIILVLLFPLAVFSETQTYVVVPRLSSMTFNVSAQMHDVNGTGNRFSGTITGDPADITTAKIELKLDPKSFDTDNEKRDKDLRDKCMEVSKYPFVEFISQSIQADQKELKAGQTQKATIQGTLKMHGLEKQVTVPVNLQLSEDTLTADGEMAIVLDEWKILRPKVLLVQLQNDVKIKFKVGAKRQQ
jgi:polyisoprenoid-binding protein YceI